MCESGKPTTCGVIGGGEDCGTQSVSGEITTRCSRSCYHVEREAGCCQAESVLSC